jgi:F0F1-type ATP synthase membrane subunit c/vacuolar-type H+-ATPase subunit K
MPRRRTTSVRASATTLLLLGMLLGTALTGLVTGLVIGPAAGPAHAADQPDPKAMPLALTIDTLTPSTLKADPTKGTVTVSGEVTNDDIVTWQDINVYATIDSQPLTTETELATANLTAVDQPWGERILTYGDFVTIPELAPGASYSYTLTIPRADLHDGSHATAVTLPGIYRFGVQALGGSPEGHDTISDGRARTYLPLVDKQPGQQPESTALVVPIRQRVLRHTDGTLVDPDRWAASVAPGGRLAKLLDFGEGHPVSWLVDPAVIAAVQQLAAGDPPRSIAPTDGTSPGQTDQPSASPTVAHRTIAGFDAQSAIGAAQTWLDRLKTALSGSEVFTLPYGDLDLASAATHDPGLYPLARQRSAAVMSAFGINDATPAEAPIDGYLPATGFALGADEPVFLSDQAINGDAPPVGMFVGHQIYVTSSAVAAGGPLPGDRLALVAIRQELLAQAALRRATGAPVVAVLPADWTPSSEDASGFFDGLGQRWLALDPVTTATAASPPQQLTAARLHYPGAERERELPATAFAAVDGLRQAGTTLQAVLSHNDQVATVVLDDALTSASYTARGGAGGAAAIRSREAIDALLHQITVEAPKSVTMSSATGRFAATVVNGLDQDVTVKLRPVTDSGITLSTPKRLDVPAKGRAGVLLSASAHTNGVHTVTLQLTDGTGRDLGTDASLPIRTAQVSMIIWVFIAAGLALLFAAIVIRLVRRLRGARETA